MGRSQRLVELFWNVCIRKGDDEHGRLIFQTNKLHQSRASRLWHCVVRKGVMVYYYVASRSYSKSMSWMIEARQCGNAMSYISFILGRGPTTALDQHWMIVVNQYCVLEVVDSTSRTNTWIGWFHLFDLDATADLEELKRHDWSDLESNRVISRESRHPLRDVS